MPNIDTTDTLKDITDRYPSTIDIFVSKGFPQMADEAKRKSFGTITLDMAMRVKGIDVNSFIKLLKESIDSTKDSLDNSKNHDTEILSSSNTLPAPAQPQTKDYRTPSPPK